MASPGKRSRSCKGVSFTWTDTSRLVLLNICANWKSNHGSGQTYKWGEIMSEFKKETGVDVTKDVLSNKIAAMKGEYALWKKLKSSETGLGFDPDKGLIIAEHDWWETKIKENTKYSKFRTIGVPPEVENLWAAIYDSSMATGEHFVAPGIGVRRRDQRPSTHADGASIHLDDAEGEETGETYGATHLEGEFAENLNVSQPSEAVHASPSIYGTPHHPKRQKRLSRQDEALDIQRNIKGQLDEYMSIVKSFSPSGQSASSQLQNPDVPSVEEVSKDLHRLVDEGILEAGSQLFGFALMCILEEKNRRLYKIVKEDSSKKAFFQVQYDLLMKKGSS